jgi:hypothetical protein
MSEVVLLLTNTDHLQQVEDYVFFLVNAFEVIPTVCDNITDLKYIFILHWFYLRCTSSMV